MFSLINLILTIFILFRVYKYDKFYMVNYSLDMKEMTPIEKKKRYRGSN